MALDCVHVLIVCIWCAFCQFCSFLHPSCDEFCHFSALQAAPDTPPTSHEQIARAIATTFCDDEEVEGHAHTASNKKDD
jgi:hypothetical protein